jgi:hypothetical protein
MSEAVGKFKDGKDGVFEEIRQTSADFASEGFEGQTRMSTPPVQLNFRTGS